MDERSESGGGGGGGIGGLREAAGESKPKGPLYVYGEDNARHGATSGTYLSNGTEFTPSTVSPTATTVQQQQQPSPDMQSMVYGAL